MRSASRCADARILCSLFLSISSLYLFPRILFECLIKVAGERCNHPDRSPRNASGRSSSRATTIPWRLRCGEPIRREDPYSREESDLDSRTPAALFVSDALNRIRRDGFAFVRVSIHPARPRSRETSSNVVDGGYQLSAHRYILYVFSLKSTLEINATTLIRGLLCCSIKRCEMLKHFTPFFIILYL